MESPKTLDEEITGLESWVPDLGLPPALPQEIVETPTAADSTEESGFCTGNGSLVKGGELSEKSPFEIGDLVWCKIKSHQWWPAQVCDPSDAPKKSPRERSGRGGHSAAAVPVTYFSDNSVAWCSPSQLKPFVQEFHQMAGQSSAKSFVWAVEAGLDEIGRYLKSQLTCSCVDEEDEARLKNCKVNRLPFSNFTVEELVERILDVAKDVKVADILEVTKLKSWVLAFSGGKGWSADPSMYHLHIKVEDLYDKVDPDDSQGDIAKNNDIEDCNLTCNGVTEGPETSEEELNERKKGTMAKLIAEMDLNTVDLSDERSSGGEAAVGENAHNLTEKEELMEDVKDLNAENAGLGRRERKKSKYLSYPYTNDAALGKSKDEKFEASRDLEEDQRGQIYKVDSTSACEIFAEFLAASVDPHHLKWNRLAKTVKGYFAVYRNSTFCSGSDFEAYQKHLHDSCCGNEDIMGTDGSEDGKCEKNKKQDEGCKTAENCDRGKVSCKRRARKAKADVVTPLSGANHSEQGTKSRSKKMRKVKADDGIILDSNGDVSEQSVTGLKRKMREGAVGAEGAVVLPIRFINSSGQGESTKRRGRKKDQINMGTADVSHGHISSPEAKTENGGSKNNGTNLVSAPVLIGYTSAAKPNNKRKKSRAGSSCGAKADVSLGITNRSEPSKSRQKKRKNVKIGTTEESIAALFLTFSSDVPMPSKNELISTFGKYGALIESETELLADSCSARVVFAASVDAEKAFNHRDSNASFKPPAVTYRLSYLPANLGATPEPLSVQKPHLPDIQKNLESMISTLSAASPLMKESGSSDGLKPETRDNLVGEMQGLLMKVNKLLSGPPTGT